MIKDVECGHETGFRTSINEPKLIESIKEFVIDCNCIDCNCIDCKCDHSYVKTVHKKHYLFGNESLCDFVSIKL